VAGGHHSKVDGSGGPDDRPADDEQGDDLEAADERVSEMVELVLDVPSRHDSISRGFA
jgi:hypothetical protein